MSKMAKRKVWRRRSTKPNTVAVYYGRDDDGAIGLIGGWGDGARRGDAMFLMWALGEDRNRPSFETFPGLKKEPSILAELEARGYDLTTLKISIERKQEP
jgi:hypothetical protein